MKKKLQKEISNLEKIHEEISKQNSEKLTSISKLQPKIDSIESKIQNFIKNKKEYEKIPKFSYLELLYNKFLKKSKEKTIMELNYNNIQKDNKEKEINLEKQIETLKEIDSINAKQIEEKIEDINEILLCIKH